MMSRLQKQVCEAVVPQSAVLDMFQDASYLVLDITVHCLSLQS